MTVCLGGVGIWCMHFIGMSAVTMIHHGETIPVRYDICLTITSLVLVLVFSAIGFYISSHDEVFTKTRKEILNLFVADSCGLSMQQALHIKPIDMIWMIATYNPVYLLCGGLCTGSGVVVMHYVGMAAMVFRGRIVWNVGMIAASCLIAFLAATAAFWILFRFLSVYTNHENLRLVCAFTMAIAICGMHYVGMLAATFEDIEDPDFNIPVKSTMSTSEVFQSGLIVAAAISFAVSVISLSDLRYSVGKLSYELSCADETVLGLPMNNPVSSAAQVRRYIAKRKASRFNLGVINQTYMPDHDEGEDLFSESSAPSTYSVLLKPVRRFFSPRSSVLSMQVLAGDSRDGLRVQSDTAPDTKEMEAQLPRLTDFTHHSSGLAGSSLSLSPMPSGGLLFTSNTDEAVGMDTQCEFWPIDTKMDSAEYPV